MTKPTAYDLALAVAEMRKAQRAYFRTRQPAVLERSKNLERRVDELVAQVLDVQGQLFEGEE